MLRTIVVSLAALFAIGAAQAQDKKPTAQQERMTQCNQEAKGMTGDARQKFMSDCLSGKPGKAKGQTAQQQKMTECNKQAAAKGLKGDARQKFMSDCLKG